MNTFRITGKKSHETHAGFANTLGYRALLVSPDPELAKQFVITVCGSSGTMSMAKIGDRQVVMEVMTPKHMASALETKSNQADMIIALIESMDRQSVETERTLLESATALEHNAVHVLVHMSQSGSTQFKMSCICGQKLYVPIINIGNKGKCPNCGTRFVIPSAENWLRECALADSSTPILSAINGHQVKCRAVIERALEMIDERNRALKSSTMPIMLSSDETHV